MHGARRMHRDIAGAGLEADLRQPPALPYKGGLYEGSVESGDIGKLPESVCLLPSPNSDGEPAALVGMSSETAVFVPGHVGDPFGPPRWASPRPPHDYHPGAVHGRRP